MAVVPGSAFGRRGVRGGGSGLSAVGRGSRGRPGRRPRAISETGQPGDRDVGPRAGEPAGPEIGARRAREDPTSVRGDQGRSA